MRVLVTGGTGFLGSCVVEELIGHGHDVAALIRPGSEPWRLAAVAGRFVTVSGSLEEDGATLGGKLAGFHPEAVLHLAWQGVGNRDRNSPMQARNIAPAVQLAALAAELGATAFIGAGSQAEYGPYPRAIREDDAARPTTLYGHAKLAAGGMTAATAEMAGMRFAWLRVFSTYGPRDHDYWLIPDLIRKLRRHQRMPLTACEQRWGFLHARDAAAAFRTVLETPSAQGVFNLGSPDAPPLRETVTALRDLVDPEGELGFGDIPYRPDQVMVLLADVTRLQSLGWRPSIELGVGLRETAQWYDLARSS